MEKIEVCIEVRTLNLMKTYIGCNKSDFSLAIIDWMGFLKNFIDYTKILHMII